MIIHFIFNARADDDNNIWTSGGLRLIEKSVKPRVAQIFVACSVCVFVFFWESFILDILNNSFRRKIEFYKNDTASAFAFIKKLISTLWATWSSSKKVAVCWCVARFGAIWTILKTWKTPVGIFTFFKLYKWYQIAQRIIYKSMQIRLLGLTSYGKLWLGYKSAL